MRQLFPQHSELELDDLHRDLTLAVGHRRAHVALGMVSSVDGAASVEGASAGLGGDADRVVFRRLRGAADAVLVGAGTVRAEDYSPLRPSATQRSARVRRGLEECPRLVIVSASLDLRPDARVFGPGTHRPVVVTSEDAARRRGEDLADVAELWAIGDRQVDLAGLTETLARRRLGRVLCEGGPALNGSLLAADLVDEVFLTLAPHLRAGGAPRIAHGGGADGRRFSIVSVHEHADELMLRYRRNRDGHPDPRRSGADERDTVR